MNKKGFTLIELLAVIVILAVIALIATPAVLNIIEDSKRSAAEDSARIIAKEAETHYMSETTLKGNEVGDIDLTSDTLKYKGEKPEKGIVTFDEKGNSYLKMYMNGYCVESNYDNTVESEKTDSEDCAMGTITVPLNPNGGTLDMTSITVDEGAPLGELPIPTKAGYEFAGWYTDGDVRVDENTLARANLALIAKWVGSSLTVTFDENRPYADGERIYFNPVTNEACTDYNAITNSADGFRGTADSGCLKWHAFLDSNDTTTIRLILDHNTSETDMVLDDAMTEIANVRDNNLYGWHEAVYPTARFMSAEEVNKIVPYKRGIWTPTVNNWYKLHDGTHYTYEGPAGTNKSAWLMDNLSCCERFGCNVQQGDTEAYWTPSNDIGWIIDCYGTFSKEFYSTAAYGIRPVIEVPKDLLSQKKEVSYGEIYGEMPTLTREGYTFTGWYTTGGEEVTSDTIYQLTIDTTLEAQWKANTYTVTFKKDNEVVSTKTVTYGGIYGTLPGEQVKPGYLFKGWKKDDFTAITSESLVTTTSNHDIEAILVEKTYLAELYFNPLTNEACTDYNATTNSKWGYVGKTGTGCMKWYAYKEDGDNYLMIVDHNTSSSETGISWTDAVTEITNVKDNNLYSWHAAVYPTARLISAEEVNEIAPDVSGTWKSSVGSKYYFQTGTSTEYRGILGTNKYGWLFDNTSGCDENGCNVAQSSSFGYWTSSVRDDGMVWAVNCDGQLINNTINNGRMVRPVISVPKSKFTN